MQRTFLYGGMGSLKDRWLNMKNTLLEERGLTHADLLVFLRSHALVLSQLLIKYSQETQAVRFLDSDKCPPLPPPSNAERLGTGRSPILDEAWKLWGRPPWNKGGARRKEIRRKTKEFWRTYYRTRRTRLPPLFDMFLSDGLSSNYL